MKRDSYVLPKEKKKKSILQRTLLIFAIIVILYPFISLYVMLDFDTKKIKNLDDEQQQAIFNIAGITEHEGVTISSFQMRRHIREAFVLIKLDGVDDIEEFVQQNEVIDNCSEIDKSFSIFPSSKYFPREAIYCALLYDKKNVYLSIYTKSNSQSSRLSNYFYEIY